MKPLVITLIVAVVLVLIYFGWKKWGQGATSGNQNSGSGNANQNNNSGSGSGTQNSNGTIWINSFGSARDVLAAYPMGSDNVITTTTTPGGTRPEVPDAMNAYSGDFKRAIEDALTQNLSANGKTAMYKKLEATPKWSALENKIKNDPRLDQDVKGMVLENLRVMAWDGVLGVAQRASRQEKLAQIVKVAVNIAPVVASAFSDKRLKTNIEPLEGSLEKILAIETYEYEYNNVLNLPKGKQFGVIAQELEEVIPELIENNGKFKKVNYVGLVPFLIGAIKEQQKQIDELKNV